MTDHRSYAYNLLKQLIIWNENLIQKYGYESLIIATLVQNLLLFFCPVNIAKAMQLAGSFVMGYKEERRKHICRVNMCFGGLQHY